MYNITILFYQDKFTDQHNSKNGKIALYTLKNPSHPEYIYIAPSGVMCLDFNPKYPHMIVAGLVCGNVAIYNMQLKTNKPTYLSSMKTGKHFDIVWKVLVIVKNCELTFMKSYD